MYPAPLIVFDADAFAERPEAPPKFNDAVTDNAFADVAGLDSETRKTNVVPATYVPLPVWYVGAPVIVNTACAFISITRLLVSGPNERVEISSVPVTVVVIVTEGWLGAPATMVTSKSKLPEPLIVFDADAFAEIPVAPPNDKGVVTMRAFADADGLDRVTRTTNVVPATYVPLPLNAVKLVIASNACALIEITRLPVSGPNARPDISSVPATVAVIVTEGWLGAHASIVIKRSMYPIPLIVFDADAFAERPEAPPKFNDAVTDNAFAEVAGLDSETRKTNVMPATYVPLPVFHVKPVIASVACALTATLKLLPDDPLITRPENCSVPLQVALIVTAGWLATPAATVTKKSM